MIALTNLVSALCAVALIGLPLPAVAQTLSTARIDLNGTVQAGTCTVAAISKAMPTVGADAFPQTAAGKGAAVASYTDFSINLTACSAVTGATFVFGTDADRHDTERDSFRNKGTGGSPYIAIWLRGTCSGGPTYQPAQSVSRTFSTATYTFPLCAQYYKAAGGLVTPGPASTNFIVTITYQ